MKKYWFVLFILQLTMQVIVAQNPDLKRSAHWYFGNFAGLDFTSGSPVPDTNGVISTLEGVSAISDTNGILQCYFGFGYQTNYLYCVYNREHKAMPNGCDLGTASVSTPRDGSIFVPKPGDDSTYYLFTVDGWENQFQRGLRWHEIDMRQDSGRGDVVSHDNVLFAPCSEQLAATRHANGCDYWVVSHERSNANFLAYKVTANGIDTVPVVSTVGTDYSIPQQLWNNSGGGVIRFSPNGTIAAAIVYWSWLVTGIPEDLELFQFDNSTGVFYNCVNLPTNIGVAGIGFSLNNTKVYSEDADSIARLYQWDLTFYDSATIVNSKIEIFNYQFSIGQDYQLANDGKLYLGCEFLNGVGNPPYLSTIENPNDAAANVIVLPGSISTNGRGVSQGLCHFVSNFTANVPPPACTAGIEETMNISSLLVYPNPADEFIFINENLNATHLKIYNMLGKLIMEQKISASKNNINVSQLKNGMYIIQIIKNEQTLSSVKLIIYHN